MSVFLASAAMQAMKGKLHFEHFDGGRWCFVQCFNGFFFYFPFEHGPNYNRSTACELPSAYTLALKPQHNEPATVGFYGDIVLERIVGDISHFFYVGCIDVTKPCCDSRAAS